MITPNTRAIILLFSIIAYFSSCTSQKQPTGEWISLFNGTDLSGWVAPENPETFKVEDGAIHSNGKISHLYYIGDDKSASFKNFNLRLKVKSSAGANGGVFFHTRAQNYGTPITGYEVQVNNSYNSGGRMDFWRTGSLHGVRNIYVSPVIDNEWFEMMVEVRGNRVKVTLDGHPVVDYKQPAKPYRFDFMKGAVFGAGTFALQCHDENSTIEYKDIEVMPLTDEAAYEDAWPEQITDEYIRKMSELHIKGYPLTDYHIHLKEGLTLDEAMKHARQTGFNYGIAVNCGKDFPVNTDEKLRQYIAENLDRMPVYKAMQGEGREWVDIFSEEARNTFDYVFTDAMTFTSLYGERVHLWIPEEVTINDPQDFMDKYVQNIKQVVENEPIDIYVNPTFLPEVIEKDYDNLWTDIRINEVVDLLVQHNIVLEINTRYKLPSAKFISMAKEKGVKFAIGTNNTNPEIGMQEYALEMIDKCGLKPEDFWFVNPKEW